MLKHHRLGIMRTSIPLQHGLMLGVLHAGAGDVAQAVHIFLTRKGSSALQVQYRVQQSSPFNL
jgi:hypothetical protein